MLDLEIVTEFNFCRINATAVSQITFDPTYRRILNAHLFDFRFGLIMHAPVLL